jgi:hypothetical protein
MDQTAKARPQNLKEKRTMKKLMVLMLGLGLAFGTVATSFAQETKKEESGKKKSGKKGGKKKEDTEKKGGH